MAKRKNQKRRSKKYQVNNRQLKAKRMYKDTIFRMLYHDKENLLSLYNAVNGREYTDPEKLQVVTLENAIYMGMKNDLAFIMDMNLYLYEHQSTYNPNIPLRNLFYIADEYQRLVVRKSLYSTVIQKIPTPRVSGYKEVYFLIRRYSPVQGLYRLFLFIGFFSFRLRVSRQMDFPHKVKDNIYFLKMLTVYLLRRMDNDFFDKFINDSGR